MADIKKAIVFEDMEKGSWYTIEGAGGDLNDWTAGYEKWLAEREIGKPKEWYTFSGEQMNEHYHLTGSNAYQKDLTFLAFPLDGLNVSRLAIFKIQMGDRWFDDIVANNAAREEVE